MIPHRLVIDTNVVVSEALKPEGLQRTVVLLAMTKPARWYVSVAIVSEYAMVLARPELTDSPEFAPSTASADQESHSCCLAVTSGTSHLRPRGQHVRRMR